MPKAPKKRVPNTKPKTKNDSQYRLLTLQMCKSLVVRHHYSRRMPASVMLSYGLVDYGPPRKTIACCLFSTPTGRWDTQKSIWELTRLVRLPSYEVPLTQLIAKALGYIRKEKLVELLISFADAEEDHHGGIYQACSWVYHGIRKKRLDGININGQFVPARTCNARYGTSSPTILEKQLKANVVPHFDSGKHCYWKALTKKGMQLALSLGFHSRPYPKPMLSGESLAKNYAIDQQQRKGAIKLPPIKRVVWMNCKDLLDDGYDIMDENQ